uniref:Putative methyltransferase n=1 Tax=viral metagenome TaxID=1070528 RepID=A0A6M3JXD7_9ZZZZ
MAKVGKGINKSRGGWDFSGKVAVNFVPHAEKSIPMYHEGHNIILALSDYFCHHDSICYDVGTSTGQLLRLLALRHKNKQNIKWVGLDIEPSMIDVAKQHCKGLPVNLYCRDAVVYDYEMADMIVAYYTMQFVPEKRKQVFISKIYKSLNWGGAFVMFEKVRAPDARFQDIISTLYTNFKMEKGFSCDEIIHKTESLKGSMWPFSTAANIDLLKRAGFTDITTVIKHLCFEGFLAIK